ncbi:MAG: hypothetical protein V1929_07210 [bacterium]
MRNASTSFWSPHFHIMGALALALFTGCIHVEQVLTLNADGSGELHVTYGMSKNDIAQMQEMSKTALAEESASNDVAATSSFDFNENDIREDFKAYEEHGVTLTSVRTEETNNWKFVYLEIGFKSLEGLSRTDFLSDRTLSLVKTAEGHYAFRQAASGPQEDAAPEGVDQESINTMMAGMMKGFHAVMKVRTPGKVLTTNAGQSDEQSATWDFDLEKDPQALQRAQKLDMRVEFDGTGLEIPEFSPVPEKP